MRQKFQWGAVFVANALIYMNDLLEAVTEALSLLMGVLL